MLKVVGVDEAGKGPVIGSLVVAVSIINLEKEEDFDSYQEDLKKLGVKDSKLLKPEKRKEVYEQLKDMMDVKFLQITPSVIDDHNRKGKTLMNLQVTSLVDLLEDIRPDVIYIDALTANPRKFGEDLQTQLSFRCKVISENKADAKYPIVGAASIVAKELREQEIAQIKENLNIDCGSGYCHDPKTIAFLQANWQNEEYSFIIRKSWATYKDLMQKKLDDFISELD